ncbi:hypothetical protein ACH4UM_29665 [Streptomyces sp. NPDC020801]|uniref:hypothetical protein n=1 Tax=unclassified Streptomyces TaxID=2593676 RepID=UPI00378D5CA5
MAFFSSRGRTPRLAPELDDADLGKLLKRLVSMARTNTAGTADLCVAQIARLLEQDPGDFDRRAHRLSVLAGFLSESYLPAAWAKREPRNASALLLQSWCELEEGRVSGGLQDAAVVWKRCLLVADIAPQDPAPWVVLLGVARLAGCARQDVYAIWNEIVTRDRWHREAYLSMLAYLSPQESGSHAQMLEFVDSVRTHMPANAPCAAVELTAHIMQFHAAVSRGGAVGLLAGNHWKGVQAAELLERARVTWPQETFFSHAAAIADLNLLAYALTAANRRREAAPLFEAIDGRVTSWPWRSEGDPLAVFESARNKAR